MITRDGDHYIIGGERIPARTECAGKVACWEAIDGGAVTSLLVALFTVPFGEEEEHPVEVRLTTNGAALIEGPLVSLRFAERNTLLAQRRCLAVLAALTQKLEG